jgi:hypothetical protein
MAQGLRLLVGGESGKVAGMKRTTEQLESEITREIARYVPDMAEVAEIRAYVIRWSGGDLEAALEWAKNPTRRGNVWTW